MSTAKKLAIIFLPQIYVYHRYRFNDYKVNKGLNGSHVSNSNGPNLFKMYSKCLVLTYSVTILLLSYNYRSPCSFSVVHESSQ